MFGDNSLISSTQAMRKEAKAERQSKLENYGQLSLILKLRQEHPICCSKTPAIENQTNKT